MAITLQRKQMQKHVHIGYQDKWEEYKMNEHILEEEKKGLGVIVNNELKFHKHTLRQQLKKKTQYLG